MQKLRQPCWNAGVLKAVTFLILSKCKATSVLQQCGQYICVKHGLSMSFHQIKYGYLFWQICLLDVSLQSFLLLPWLLLHPCIMISEEELVVKSYERGSIISHALAHSWKREFNCFFCVLAVNMKNPTLRWRDRGHGWTSSGLGGGGQQQPATQLASRKQRGKVTGRSAAESNRKQTLPRRPSS